MPRKSKIITFSPLPELAAHIGEIRNEKAGTTSELVREALRRYMQEWK